MTSVGPLNAITDVPGLKVGNAGDSDLRSGTTVLLPDQRAVAAVDLRGGGTGTRETALLDPAATMDAVDAIVLSGGSAFGLEAAGGVMDWLRAQGRGFRVGSSLVPIVPAAILFDLNNGGDKDWGAEPPYKQFARQAVNAAGQDFALGTVGAGIGATAGPLKGGLGSASVVLGSGITVGALAAVNSLGSVLMPKTSTFWAWAFERNNELGGQRLPAGAMSGDFDYPFPAESSHNTTLAVVATDAVLTKAQAQRVAIMAQDGLARAIRPVHTPLDGDIVFALSTARSPLEDPVSGVARIGMAAADCLARAIARGVYEAETLGDMQSYRDLYP